MVMEFSDFFDWLNELLQSLTTEVRYKTIFDLTGADNELEYYGS
jgi:hypothetical protein